MLEPRVAMAPEAQQETWQTLTHETMGQDSLTHQQFQQSMIAGSHMATPIANQSTYQTPQLRMTTLGPQQANIHRASQFRFRIINDGPIVAEGVNLTIDVGEADFVEIHERKLSDSAPRQRFGRP